MQSFEEYYHVINEEYTYYYDELDLYNFSDINRWRKVVMGVCQKWCDLIHSSEDGMTYPEGQDATDYFYGLENAKKLLDHNKVIKHFELFYELEYKLHKARKYNNKNMVKNISKAINRIYPVIALYIKTLIETRNLASGNQYFRGWKDTKYNYVYENFKEAMDRLNSAKSIPDKIVAITYAMNVEHDQGPVIGGFWIGPDQDDYDRLSNLPTAKWDQELKKEIGSSIL